MKYFYINCTQTSSLSITYNNATAGALALYEVDREAHRDDKEGSSYSLSLTDLY